MSGNRRWLTEHSALKMLAKMERRSIMTRMNMVRKTKRVKTAKMKNRKSKLKLIGKSKKPTLSTNRLYR